jgi:hypothetical protein
MADLPPPPPKTPMLSFYSEEEIEDLAKFCSFDRPLSVDKSSRKILMLLSGVFIEELLDLTLADKGNVTISAINRMLALKFPEISDEIKFTIEHLERRGREIAKEDFN